VAAVLQAIESRAPDARVLVVGYPDILPVTGHGCWPLVPFAFGDVPYLRGIEVDLNQMLARTAAANGATFVGLVIGGGKMIEAYATGFPIRIATYTNRDPIGFTRPWANLSASQLAAASASSSPSG
jgi:hypothetical protein